MLNEIKAFDEYTCELSSGNICRLNEEVLKNKNHLNGMTGAMTVIARAELDNRGYFQASESEQRDIIEQVIECLREWVGFADESTKMITSYCNWFKKYYESRIIPLDTSEDKTQIKPWEKIKKEKKNGYEDVLVNTTCDVDENSNIKITYERIVADAIFFGPLHRYYLVFKEEAINSLTNNKKQMDPKKKKSGEKIENALKLISLYLLKRAYTGNTANVINNADLANWAQCYTIFHDGCAGKKGYFNGIKYNENPLFSNMTVAGNVSKLIVNPNFLSDFDFRIVLENDFEGVSDGYVFYSDLGAGFPLARNKRY